MWTMKQHQWYHILSHPVKKMTQCRECLRTFFKYDNYCIHTENEIMTDLLLCTDKKTPQTYTTYLW